MDAASCRTAPLADFLQEVLTDMFWLPAAASSMLQIIEIITQKHP